MKNTVFTKFIINIRHSPSAILLALCLAAGLICSLYLLAQDNVIVSDGFSNIIAGKNLVTGKGYTVNTRPQLWFHPLYPLATGILYRLIGNIELSAHIVSIISFVLSIALVYLLGRLIYNERAGLFSAILFAFNPLILGYSYMAVSHSLDIFFKLASLYMVILISKNQKRLLVKSMLLGSLFGLSILTRPENIITSFVLIMILLILIKARFTKKVIYVSCLLCTATGILFPYINFLHKHTGDWTLTSRLVAIERFEYLNKNDPYMRHKTKLAGYEKFDLLRYLKDNREELTIRYKKGITRLAKTMFPLLYLGLGYMLIGIGLFGAKWDRDRRKTEILLFASLSYMLILPFGNVLPRYLLPALSIFILWMGKGLDCLFNVNTNNQQHLIKKKMSYIGIIVFIIIGIFTAKYIMQKKPNKWLNSKYMGLWMKDNIKNIHKKRIADFTPSVAFYSGARLRKIPYIEDYNELISYLKEKKCDYLIINTAAFKNYPHLRFLMNDKKKHDYVVRIHVIQDRTKIILYKIE